MPVGLKKELSAELYTRVCFKIHSRHLHAPLCGIFAPNSGCVARYAPFIRDKSTTNCDTHLSESNFQTRSRVCFAMFEYAQRKGKSLWMRKF
ncbi:DUF6783 domain-containing protein [Robinsoniella sp. RHS]|uniref:DUF6783 domain-containing protein n=1 Tax=Robinsoniella sp. RHS TaxID=1504536 RepID=UPI003750A1AC